MHDYDLDEIRRRLPMLEVCTKEGVEFKKMGTNMRAQCPFHAERSASFNISAATPHKAHCFGCGWSGDIFQFWMERRGITEFREAVGQLAELAGLASLFHGVTWSKPKAKVVTQVTVKAGKLGEKPALPKMRGLRPEEIEQLAVSRGLSVQGVTLAAHTFRRAGFAMWPQWQGDDGQWRPRSSGCWPSWVVTDDTRNTAEFRRLDGVKYPTKEQPEGGIKAWSTKGKSWPIGAAEIGNKRCVLLVEGGPDLLAAYHFLWGFGQLDKVAVVGMLGTSNRIAQEALGYFKNCRVRIMMDADEVKEKVTKRADGTETIIRSQAGIDAAVRWQNQLTEAGAAVEPFHLGEIYDGDGQQIAEGLLTAAGERVKDLNDLAKCSAAVVGSWQIQEAFCEWIF